VLNVDIGGGTTKLALCEGGRVRDVAALDIGARLVTIDAQGVVTRLEEAGTYAGSVNGMPLTLGQPLPEGGGERLAAWMAGQLFAFINGQDGWDRNLLRTAPLPAVGKLAGIVFSGGVSEFVYGQESRDFGDLGRLLGQEIRTRAEALGVPITKPVSGIRATVVGASQFTVQVSGSTIFLAPPSVVPIRNVPVIAPHWDLAADHLDAETLGESIATALRRTDLHEGNGAVAVKLAWGGSATYQRLNALCTGLRNGLQSVLANGHPVVLVCDGDVGGLLGIHLKEEMKLPNPVVSVDGVELRELDYVDIGEMIPTSGAVPVVIKSLVFPS
jgi:ethanolamine utilization protein EutA